MAPTKSEFLGYKPNELVGHAQDVQALFNELDSHGESLTDAHGQVQFLAANASANMEISKDGVKFGAGAEADLAKGSASAEFSHGPMVEKVSVSGAIDARADAGLTVGKDGFKAEASAFAGAEANLSQSVGVKGATVDTTVGVTAGIGASGDATFGMGEDGKFHLGLHGKFAVGVGLNFSAGATIDPQELTKTAGEVAHDVGNAYHETAHAVSSVANTVGNALESINPFDW